MFSRWLREAARSLWWSEVDPEMDPGIGVAIDGESFRTLLGELGGPYRTLRWWADWYL